MAVFADKAFCLKGAYLLKRLTAFLCSHTLLQRFYALKNLCLQRFYA